MMCAQVSLLGALCIEIGSFCSVLALTQARHPGHELCRVAMSENTLTEYGVRWFWFLWLSCGHGLMRRVQIVAQRRLAGHDVDCMERMKMEARETRDARRRKRRRQRQDGDGPGRVIEASVTVSVGGGDVDITLLARMQDFLQKENCAGLCAVERGGIAFNLHFEMVVRIESILAKVNVANVCDSTNHVDEDIPDFQLGNPYLPLVHSCGVNAIALSTMDEGIESIGVKATHEEDLRTDDNNCPIATLRDFLCNISIELLGDNSAN
ncbi:hypothetical protein L7F22_029316 [Adiantum nelumboides]|nr:hypothetical protein [Adiantum nelumboides]